MKMRKTEISSYSEDITRLGDEGKSPAAISAFLWISYQSKFSPAEVNNFIIGNIKPLTPTTINEIKILRETGYTRPQISDYIQLSLNLTVSPQMISKIIKENFS